MNFDHQYLLGSIRTSSPENNIQARGLNLEESNALRATAAKLKIPTEWLYHIIAFESKFDPFMKNPAPKSTARGLLQFVNDAAISMGYKSSEDLVLKNPTRTSQILGPVYQFLKGGMPYKSLGHITMYMLAPSGKYKNYSLTQALPPAIQKANSIRHIKDYQDKMLKNNSSFPYDKKVAGIPKNNTIIAALVLPFIYALT